MVNQSCGIILGRGIEARNGARWTSEPATSCHRTFVSPAETTAPEILLTSGSADSARNARRFQSPLAWVSSGVQLARRGRLLERMHLNAARALLHSGRIEDALDSLKRAEEIHRDLNWATEIARARTNAGAAQYKAGLLLLASRLDRTDSYSEPAGGLCALLCRARTEYVTSLLYSKKDSS